MTGQTQKARVYKSRAANHVLQINPGKLVQMENGVTTRLGYKCVEFRPLAHSGGGEVNGSGWGVYETKDQEEIDYLDSHIQDLKDAGQVPDILPDEEWAEAITPPDKKNKMLKGRMHQLERQLEEKNKLLAILQAQQKTKTTPRGKSA